MIFGLCSIFLSSIFLLDIAKHFLFYSNGEVWKEIRSSASKQVVPRRVGNFVEPLCDIADELLEHLESTRKESGNDIRPEVNKWAFQGMSILYCDDDSWILLNCVEVAARKASASIYNNSFCTLLWSHSAN